LSYQAPTASLAGKKLTLSWVAPNEATQKAIEALIPTPPPGQELDPSQLPRGLSSSIALTPTIRLDGQTVASGSAMSVGSEPKGAGAFTRYGSQQWDESQDDLIVGQQSAIGLSIQGISQQQLETLKTRMGATKATLEQAQAAPQDQRATILQGMTSDNLTGDALTATIWGYFVGVESTGNLASTQAQTFDMPALSYGLFHLQVKPNTLYGIVTTGITFQGVNMDIGHMRYIRWVKDDNPASAINNKPELTQNGKSAAQNRWIAYNRMRGQNTSAMEHVAPEQFWEDKSVCSYTDENGQVQNSALAPCQQAISAVKAIAIAQSEGQKIYTITPQNAATALQKLPVGGDVGDEIRNAVQAGKEVMVHEKAINANGWTGYGYIIMDPDTGAGSYLIEGGSHGAIMIAVGLAMMILGVMELLTITALSLAAGPGAPAAIAVALLLGVPAILVGVSLFFAGVALLLEDAKTCHWTLGLAYDLSNLILGVASGVAFFAKAIFSAIVSLTIGIGTSALGRIPITANYLNKRLADLCSVT
jgi:hypothetical protein